MTMTKYIHYKEYLKRTSDLSKLKEQGVIFILKKHRVKILAGLGLIITSVILPLDFGLFAVCGLFLLSTAGIDLYLYKEEIIRRLKNKLRK